MTTAEDVLWVARSLLGTQEDPPGSNHNFITDWYGCTGPYCYWCAMSVSYEMSHAGMPVHIAWAPSFFSGMWPAVDLHDGQPGDPIGYDEGGGNGQDHMGIIEAPLFEGGAQTGYITLEGNWGDAFVRVYRRFTDTQARISAICRPPYEVPAPTPPAPAPVPQHTEEEMVRDVAYMYEYAYGKGHKPDEGGMSFWLAMYKASGGDYTWDHFMGAAVADHAPFPPQS